MFLSNASATRRLSQQQRRKQNRLESSLDKLAAAQAPVCCTSDDDQTADTENSDESDCTRNSSMEVALSDGNTSTSSTSATEEGLTIGSTPERRSVRFSVVQIQEYALTTMMGAGITKKFALTLDWAHTQEQEMNLTEYEASRGSVHKVHRMAHRERCRRLTEVMGLSAVQDNPRQRRGRRRLQDLEQFSDDDDDDDDVPFNAWQPNFSLPPLRKASTEEFAFDQDDDDFFACPRDRPLSSRISRCDFWD